MAILARSSHVQIALNITVRSYIAGGAMLSSQKRQRFHDFIIPKLAYVILDCILAYGMSRNRYLGISQQLRDMKSMS